MNISTERIIKELQRPESYPHPVDEVKFVQTHISLVFLAGDRAYKIKKPVDFGFLDFTTLQKRRHFCQEEVRLNRRLTSDVYLEVAPVIDGREGLVITTAGAPQLPGSKTVEYAVVMKRLDESRFLSNMLKAGTVDPGSMKIIARRVADFHRSAETSSNITALGGTEAVVFNTEEDFQQVGPYIGDTISRETLERIVDYTRTYLIVNRELFADRETGGWIRDGHGDLHTQHICLTRPIQIFDCIEFNERFRYGDILVDAAFLKMDLEKLGFKGLASDFTDSYLALMDQSHQRGLFNFYACYRAFVRGKVEGFRSRDPAMSKAEAKTALKNAREYFLLSEEYSRTVVPPVLIASCGLMGSGKSTLAKALASNLDLVILSSDAIRKELAGTDVTSPHHVPYGSGIYSEQFTARTYTRLHELAARHLEGGQSVFLDASYIKPGMRREAAETARRIGSRFLLVHLDPGRDHLMKRLRERNKDPGNISDGRAEILDDQIKGFEPPRELPTEQVLTLKGIAAPDQLVREIYDRVLSTT